MPRPRTALLLALLLLVAGWGSYAAGTGQLPELLDRARALLGPGSGGPAQVTWCPMDPQVVRKGPGMCPICNMELVPKEGGAPAEPGVLVLSSRQVQQAGVRLGTARPRDLVREIDATGRLEVNPANLRSLTMPFPGTSIVREVHVHAAGASLREGAVVLEVHNAELLALLKEYRGVLSDFSTHRRNQDEDQAAESLKRMNELRGQAANWGLDGANLSFFASQPKFQFSDPEFPVYAPLSGAVLEEPGLYEGMRLQRGQELLRVADLSELWLYVDLYEHELPFVEPNQTIEFTSFAVPDEVFRTTIRFIEPLVQAGTQTIRARGRVTNRGGRLAPGMFVRSRIACPVPGALSVPESSVLRSGRRDVVIVSEGGGRYRPRVVELGRQHLYLAQPEDAETAFGPGEERFHEILGGLTAGDRVVVAGNFLLNAEAQFQGVLKKMIESAEAQAQAGELSAEEAAAMEAVLGIYLGIADALVADEAAPLPALAADLVEAAGPTDASDGVRTLLEGIGAEGRNLGQLAAAADPDWDALRTSFGTLSRQVVGYLREYAPGRVAGGELFLFRCPMADDFGFDLWVQRTRELENPYMGQMMLECGMPAELE